MFSTDEGFDGMPVVPRAKIASRSRGIFCKRAAAPRVWPCIIIPWPGGFRLSCSWLGQERRLRFDESSLVIVLVVLAGGEKTFREMNQQGYPACIEIRENTQAGACKFMQKGNIEILLILDGASETSNHSKRLLSHPRDICEYIFVEKLDDGSVATLTKRSQNAEGCKCKSDLVA